MPHEIGGSQLYTATELGERALRMIGAFSINDTAARPADLQETMFWLDMLMAFEAGTGQCFWLMRDEQSIPLVAGTSSYDLNTLLPDLKSGVQFPTAAMLEDANGNRTPISIVPQSKFRQTVKPDTDGTPTCLFIDRLNDGQTMYVYPVPTSTDEDSTIILTVQAFAPSVRPRGTAKNNTLGNEKADFPQAYNLWAVHALAALIGNGPVRALPQQRVTFWENKAATLHLALDAYQNRDHDNEPPIARASSYA